MRPFHISSNFRFPTTAAFAGAVSQRHCRDGTLYSALTASIPYLPPSRVHRVKTNDGPPMELLFDWDWDTITVNHLPTLPQEWLVARAGEVLIHLTGPTILPPAL
jgi:hypothetical protein